ncbi:saccharolysin [Anaeramoeba flamelloides]|uniref:Saccharolysin n=1 Tax=Anaeramoeba flamelloides TaxID=1746091 RepID=A0AAV7ZP07_9EUKA|nr:saccharolysin [Anaeramoeba flamelloides]
MENGIRFDFTPEEIKEKSNALIEESKKFNDSVVGLEDGKRTAKNTLIPMIEDDRKFLNWQCIISLLSETSTNKEVRDMCREVDADMDKFAIEQSMREDLFLAFKDYANSEDAKSLTGQYKRYVERTLRDFKRSGLDLPEEKRNKLKELKKTNTEKGIEFSKNVNEGKSKLWFKKEELEGMPKNWVDNLTLGKEENEGKLQVTMNYPDVFPILKNCTVEETRKQVLIKFGQRGGQENATLTEEICQIRKECATLLGYDCYADFAIEVKMAKTSENVLEFLNGLADQLSDVEELNRLRELKRKTLKLGENEEIVMNDWDWRYYHQLLMKTEYQVDPEAIRNYFPLEYTLEGIFNIYKKIFGITLKEDLELPRWHKDVKKFDVFDTKTEDFVGQIYLDLYPREGKYNHAAAFTLRKSCLIHPEGFSFGEKGVRQYPISVCVANFTKPTKTTPSLLLHNEVTTLFHELGHLFHNVLSKVDVVKFAGTSVERDFVETHSQCMENFAWHKKSLKEISKHHETEKPLPDELIEKMIAAKNVNTAILNRRQLFYGLFDMTLHTQENFNTKEISDKLRKQICHIENAPDTNIASNFAHIIHGYQAGYYSYLWSLVFAQDVFSLFENTDIFSAETGLLIREKLFSVGGTEDGMQILKNVLGREPNKDAFLRSIGLKK